MSLSTDWIELLLHPVRIRIVNAMQSGALLTTAELCQRMPDVSQATMYRQVAVLVEAGVLEVASEDRTRGPAERRYRLQMDRARITSEDSAAMSLEDHRRGFTAAMGALLGEFNGYLDHEGADPYHDGVSYRQFVLWLTKAEVETLREQLSGWLADVMKRRSTPDRRPYLLSTIFFPTDRAAG